MLNNKQANANITGKDITIKGDICSAVSVSISSQVEGNITCEADLELSDSAHIKGNIKATSVSISGAVIGDIEASGLVVLKKSASVTGNIKATAISVDEGSIFNGHCVITQKEAA